MRMLVPFMWPRKSLGLQLVVMVCVLLLVAGRVVNLYTPIMYKYIGECAGRQSLHTHHVQVHR